MIYDSPRHIVEEGSIVLTTAKGEVELPVDTVITSIGCISDNTLASGGENVHLLGGGAHLILELSGDM